MLRIDTVALFFFSGKALFSNERMHPCLKFELKPAKLQLISSEEPNCHCPLGHVSQFPLSVIRDGRSISYSVALLLQSHRLQYSLGLSTSLSITICLKKQFSILSSLLE